MIRNHLLLKSDAFGLKEMLLVYSTGLKDQFLMS